MHKSIWKRIWKKRSAYLFISPFFIGFGIFQLFPIIYSIFLSFNKWNGFGVREFVKFNNYIRAFNDTRFIQSIKNTVILWLGHIFIMMALAIFIAVILNKKQLIGRRFYRMAIYMPNVTAIAAMTLVFGLIFDSQYGVLNSIITSLIDIAPIPWLTEPNYARLSIIILNTWAITGFFMMIILAGLQSIDTELYEAAETDGASAWQKFLYITLPGLQKVLFFCFVVETIGSLGIFTEPAVLTQGGPSNSTLSISLYIYNVAFKYNRFGYAAALSFILFAMIFVASIIQMRFYRDEE